MNDTGLDNCWTHKEFKWHLKSIIIIALFYLKCIAIHLILPQSLSNSLLQNVYNNEKTKSELTIFGARYLSKKCRLLSPNKLIE